MRARRSRTFERAALLFGLAVVWSSDAAAQLSGAYTISPGGDYATIGAAVADLYAEGVSGPVTFEIGAGTWTGNGGDGLVLDLPSEIPGVSETSRVIFEAAPGESAATVILERSTVDPGYYAVQLAVVRSSYVTLRNLTLRSTDPTSLPANEDHLILLGPAPGAGPLVGFTLEDCVIDGGPNYVSSALRTDGVVEDTLIQRNAFSRLPITIHSQTNDTRTRIEDNDFTEMFAYTFAGSAIFMRGSIDLVIRGNRMDTPGGWSVFWVIYVADGGAVGENALIEGNRIANVTSGDPVTGNGIGIYVSNVEATVVDNMVSGYSQSVIGSYGLVGIYVNSSRPVTVAHNSVRIGPQPNYNFSVWVQGAGAHRIVNNVVAHEVTGGGSALYIQANTERFDGYTIESNALSAGDFAALVRVNFTLYDSIAAWQTTGKGAGSVELRPEFVLDEDLHLGGCSVAEPLLIGQPLLDPALATDFDGEPREPLLARMGADQIQDSASDLFAPAVDYLVGDMPLDLAAADFDGDLDLDLAVSRLDPASGGSIEILVNAGDGTFPSRVSLGVGGVTSGPALLRAGDIDGDGAVDLATNLVNATAPGDPDNQLHLYWGNGDLSFEGPLPAMASPNGVGPPAPFLLPVTDLDITKIGGGGTRSDIVVMDVGIVGGIQPGALHPLYALEGRVFDSVPFASSLPTNPNDMLVADLDLDGSPEVLTGPTTGFDTVHSGVSLVQLPSPLVTGPAEIFALEPAATAAAPLESGPFPALIYDGEDGAAPSSICYQLNDNGTLLPPVEVVLDWATPYRRPGPLVAFDHEGDGDVDVLVGNRADVVPGAPLPGSAALLVNDGNANLSERIVCGDIGLPRATKKLVAHDFDGDGRDDVAALMLAWDSISILRNASLVGLPAQQVDGLAGVFDGTNVELSWSTPSETQNAGFGIERRDDPSLAWTPIGIVPGVGESTGTTPYDYDDLGVPPTPSGNAEYRLRQVDLDGDVQYVGPVTVAVPEPGFASGLLVGLAWLGASWRRARLRLLRLERRTRFVCRPGAVALGLALSLVASPSDAATFALNSNQNRSDISPGDGLCATGFSVDGQPECTLRAAIQEANALAGIDFLNVDPGIALTGTGYVSISPTSPLPAITDLLFMDFDNAPGYDAGDPFATPIVQLSGLLAGANGSDGLRIEGAAAAGTRIRALAVYGFSGWGIRALTSFVNIHGCQVGILRGQTELGNGYGGIQVTGDSVVVGQEFNEGPGWQEKGNVIAGNDGPGIRVSGNDVIVAGNRIGTDPTGLVAMGNRTGGVITTGSRTSIGAVRARTNGETVASGNLIAASDSFFYGVDVGLGATDTTIEANWIGTDVTGNAVHPNQGGGIRVNASRTTIGSPDSPLLGSNLISGNVGPGIDVSGSLPVVIIEIVGNRIGLRQDAAGPLGNTEAGIFAVDVDELKIVGNEISGNGEEGIHVRYSQDVDILGNSIGTDSSGADLGNGSHGVWLHSVDDGVVSSSAGSSVVAFNGGAGVRLSQCTSCQVTNTRIGSGAGESGAGNALHGIHVLAGDSALVLGNEIGENGGDGVRVEGATSTGNQITLNRIFDNVGAGIDLAGDGPTANDPEDADTGENHWMNHPELDVATTLYYESTGRIDVGFRLDASPANARYPVAIDFFEADAAGEEGARFLARFPMSSPNELLITLNFSPPQNGSYADAMVVATATDADGNSSEFSPAVPLPEPALGPALLLGAAALGLAGSRRLASH